MIDVKERIATYPQIGSYGLCFKYFFEQGLGISYKIPPKMTEKTFELGVKYSPDAVCAPFKFMLGSYLEAIDEGANILVGLGGFCRLDYFFELQEDIIKERYEDLIFVNFSQTRARNVKAWYDKFKYINPDLSLIKLTKAMPVFVDMIKSIDWVEDFLRKNKAFEKNKGEFDKIYQDYLSCLYRVKSKEDLDYIDENYKKKLKEVPTVKRDKAIRVAIIGEYYTIMEAFVNHYVEDFLMDRFVSVDRWVDFTNTLVIRPLGEMKESIKDYASYDMGATNIFTLARALEAGKNDYDGIIHVRSMGCTPEIDAQVVLDNISKDFDLPIVYLTYDSSTTDLAIKTRLEAFYDMIIMKKRKKEVI